MGLDFVDANVEIPYQSQPLVGEIDLVFEFDHTLFLIEVGAGKSNINDKKWAFFCKWANSRAIAVLKDKIDRHSHEITRIYFDLRHIPKGIGGPEAVGVAEPGSGNMICDKTDFKQLVDRIRRGDAIRDDFLLAVASDYSSSENARNRIGIRSGMCFIDEVVNPS